MNDFTLATYNPTIHDFNGDGRVDDSTGDGIPDDRDGDGFPDGPWGSSDVSRSAGPGFTLPVTADFCYGYNGNMVVASWSFTRSKPYWLRADDGNYPISDDNVEGSASFGATSGPPTIRFTGDWRASNFSHEFEGSWRSVWVLDDRDNYVVNEYLPQIPSCLVPPWMLNPPNGIEF
jgi:hypothetical protein